MRGNTLDCVEKGPGSIPGSGRKNNLKLMMSSDGICKYLPGVT